MPSDQQSSIKPSLMNRRRMYQREHRERLFIWVSLG